MTEQWHFTSEFHFRRTNFLTDWEQFIVRPSIHYKPSNAYGFAIGYSYIQNYTYSDFRIPINANEHNVWQEITLKHESEKLKFDHRFRLEERFIDKIIQSPTGTYTIDGTNYNNRFRYRFTLTRPIIKIEEEKFIFIKIFDEFFISLDKGIRPKTFNQNWLYIGLYYPIAKHFNLGLGYHNIGLQGGINTFITNHILQTTINYAIN